METRENSIDMSQIESGWRPETEALLQDWRSRVYAAQAAYYLEATRFKRWHYVLGIAVVILSTIVGSSAFADKPAGEGIPAVMIGLMGSLAAILAGLQTFLKLSESAALHGVAADWYASIRRDIEQLQALPPHLRGNVKETLDAIRHTMNKVGQNAPQLNEHLWARMARRFGVKEPPVHGVGRESHQPPTVGSTAEH
jgi:hypothetical protein